MHPTLVRAGLVLCCGWSAGCGSALFQSGAVGYDAQGCVETSLRRQTSPALAREAVPTFASACQSGDAAACSAMGVVWEIGLDRPIDLAQAHAHYARACAAGNQRGCVNMAELDLRPVPGAATDLLAVAHAHALLFTACDKGEASGCTRLGARLVKNDKDAYARDSGRRMLVKACDADDPEACFQLAELAPKAEQASRATLELLVRSCVAGHEVACSRLAGKPAHVADKPAASATIAAR